VLRGAMVRGFWGQVAITVNLEDGYIAEDVEIAIRQNHRLSKG
jgi:hypothetical protein